MKFFHLDTQKKILLKGQNFHWFNHRILLLYGQCYIQQNSVVAKKSFFLHGTFQVIRHYSVIRKRFYHPIVTISEFLHIIALFSPYIEKNIWLEKHTVWLLSSQHKFIVISTKFWFRQQKIYRTNQTHFSDSTKLLLSEPKFG